MLVIRAQWGTTGARVDFRRNFLKKTSRKEVQLMRLERVRLAKARGWAFEDGT